MTDKYKGQVATEFLLYMGVFMFVVIAAFLVVNHIQMTEIPRSEYSVARETGEGFAHVITLSVKGGDGFAYNYSFQKRLFSVSRSIGSIGTPYILYFIPQNHTMIMEWEGSYGNFSHTYKLPAYDYEFEVDNSCIGRINSAYYLDSSECSMINLENDGEREILIIKSG